MLESIESVYGFPPCLVLERGDYSLADRQARRQMSAIERRALLFSVSAFARRACPKRSLPSPGARGAGRPPRQGHRPRMPQTFASDVVCRRERVEAGGSRTRRGRGADRGTGPCQRVHAAGVRRCRGAGGEGGTPPSVGGHVVIRRRRLRSLDL